MRKFDEQDRHARQEDHRHGIPAPGVRRLRYRSLLVRERSGGQPEPDKTSHRNGDRCCGSRQLDPARVEDKHRDEPDRRRDPGTTAEGEEHRGRDHAGGCSGRHPNDAHVRMAGYPDGENHPHRSEQTERIPVAERHGQLVGGYRIGRCEVGREEPRRQRVRGHRGDSGEEAERQPTRGEVSPEDRKGKRQADVDDITLDLADGPRKAFAPEGREPDPRDECRQPDQEQRLQPEDANRDHEDQPCGAECQEGHRLPSPRRREIRSVVGAHDDDDRQSRGKTCNIGEESRYCPPRAVRAGSGGSRSHAAAGPFPDVSYVLGGMDTDRSSARACWQARPREPTCRTFGQPGGNRNRLPRSGS